MNTTLVKLSPALPLEPQLMPAADCLRGGGTVVFPTETVYGLGANALCADSVRKIYEAKGRPSDNPLIVHVSDPAHISEYAKTCRLAERLFENFMPGPFTLILPKRDIVPYEATAGLDTVAVRCPENLAARTLISLAGVPVAAPSANLSGKPSPTSAEHVIEDLWNKVDYIINGGQCEIGLESAVVIIEDGKLRILRPGAVGIDELSAVAGKGNVIYEPGESAEHTAAPRSPGMKYRHYAPNAPLYLLKMDDQAFYSYISGLPDKKIGVICYNEDAEIMSAAGNVYVLTMGGKSDTAAQAKNIFALLRQFNRLDVDVIYCRAPENKDNAIGLAMYNRLGKAAAEIIE